MIHGQATMTCTRRSLATQLREALDTMVERGEIKSWTCDYGRPDRVAYMLHAESNYGPFGVDVNYDFTPGECMGFVNEYGYEVAIGKA